MTGIERISKERQRQIEKEGFDDRHDDQYGAWVLSAAAFCYLVSADKPTVFWSSPPNEWPWDRKWWKPSSDAIRNLEKAGALIAAEIDRLERIRAETGD